MIIKTGGGDPATGAPEGIHWHMNIGNKIDYVAADDKRQIIPYIHVEDLQGRVTEYYAKDSKLTKDQIAKAPRHHMDCVDCHNRPTHIYVPPDQAVDQSLLARRIDVSLPFIKQQAVTVLDRDLRDDRRRHAGHRQRSRGFLREEISGCRQDQATGDSQRRRRIQQIFKHTTFPEMKLNWQTHPNNLGHYYFNGCFRCHDGQHVSADGKVISKDCNQCHTLLSDSDGTNSLAAAGTATFKHPVDLGDLTQVNCADCHTGGVGP